MSSLVNTTKFYISTAVVAETVDTAAEYAALTYVEIVKVFDLGEFGDLHEAVEDSYIGEARVRRLKGTVDGGTMDLVVTVDADDLGQDKLVEARGASGDFAFKIVLPDKKTSGGAGTTFYYRAAVLGGRTSLGEANSVIRATWSLAINSDQIKVPAS